MIKIRNLLTETDSPTVDENTYISKEKVKRIYDKMGYDFDFSEFVLGINTELEHKDVTGGNLIKTAKIAAAHLREVPDYYTKLKKYVETKNEDIGGVVGSAPNSPGLVAPGGYINGAPKPKDVKKMRKALNKENVMVKLSDLILENAILERRINLQRVEMALEKILPELKPADKKILEELFLPIKEMIEKTNAEPYTIFNAEKWRLICMIVYGQLAALHIAVEEIAEKNKDVNCLVLIRAINGILTY